jgi:hypothetical protein
MALTAKQYKKIAAQESEDIYAKDDEKALANPVVNQPEPDMDKNPMQWRDWDVAKKRYEEAKRRRESKKPIDASNKRGIES